MRLQATSVAPINVCPVGHTAMQTVFASSDPEHVTCIINLLKTGRKSPKEFLRTEPNLYCHIGTTCDQTFKNVHWTLLGMGVHALNNFRLFDWHSV